MHLLKLTASLIFLLGLVAAIPQYAGEDDAKAAAGADASASAPAVGASDTTAPSKGNGKADESTSMPDTDPATGSSQMDGKDNSQMDGNGNMVMSGANAGGNDNAKGKGFMGGPPGGMNDFKGFGGGHPHGRFGS